MLPTAYPATHSALLASSRFPAERAPPRHQLAGQLAERAKKQLPQARALLASRTADEASDEAATTRRASRRRASRCRRPPPAQCTHFFLLFASTSTSLARLSVSSSMYTSLFSACLLSPCLAFCSDSLRPRLVNLATARLRLPNPHFCLAQSTRHPGARGGGSPAHQSACQGIMMPAYIYKHNHAHPPPSPLVGKRAPSVLPLQTRNLPILPYSLVISRCDPLRCKYAETPGHCSSGPCAASCAGPCGRSCPATGNG
jgi:hypothetical protein